MLTAINLTAETAGKTILNGLSLTVNAGEVHAIMGPNGAGQTARLRLAADAFVATMRGI